MAYTTIDNPADYFNTVIWSGDDTSSRNITGVGFQSDLVWGKVRSRIGNHWLIDSIRGTTGSLYRVINADDSAAEQATNNDGTTAYGIVTTIGSDGFTVADGNQGDLNSNNSGDTYLAWCWKAGTTSSLSGGDITPSPYSYNATSGFGIYKYTGNGSTDQEIPHGLGKKPQMIFFKRLDSSTNWVVQSNLLGNRVQLVINDNTAENTDSRLGASDDWSSTIFNVGTYGDMNSSSDPHVAYAFCNIQGYSKIGTYTGNGNADGTFVFCGFRPAFVLLKNTNGTLNWNLQDNKRWEGYNEVQPHLAPNLSAQEYSSSSYGIDILSNGFKIRNNLSVWNGSGNTLIYAAFAEQPFVNSNGVPCNAR